MTPPTVDIAGAADLLKVHPETVRSKILAGELPAAKIGSAWVLLTRDVLAHVEHVIAQQTAQRLGSGRVSRARRPNPSRAGLRSA